jgi:hypothetical protein
VDQNDPPVNNLPVLPPGGHTTPEDTALVFATASSNALSVSDPDAGDLPVRVTLSVDHGTLSLAQTTDLTFTTGDGDADATMTFEGTLTAINAALDGLRYDPALNYNGPDVLTITSNDLGNSGPGGPLTDTDTLAITVTPVNDAPVVSVPGPQGTDEDTPLVFATASSNRLSVSDVDAGAAAVRVTLAVTNGTLTLPRRTGLTFTSGDGTADVSMTFTGALVNVNNALDGLRFDPATNFNGSATLTFTTNDQGNTGAGGPQSDSETVTINVAAVNDPPTLGAIGNRTIAEGSEVSFTATATDPDQPDDTLTFSLDAGAPAGATIDATTGLFRYTPPDGPASVRITVRVTDAGNPALSDAEEITIDVSNVVPTLSISGASVAEPNQPYTLNLSATDPGADTIDHWMIAWGDGNIEVVNGNPRQVTHVYANVCNATITATATDEDGTYSAGSLSVRINVSRDVCFVHQAYLDLLRRPADLGGVAYYVGRLEQGTTRTEVAALLMDSREYRTVVVNDLYLAYLGRPADPMGLVFGLQILEGSTLFPTLLPTRLDVLKSQLLASAEYYFVKGGGTDAGFLSALYRDVLGREIDPGGLSYYLGQLASGMSRVLVARSVLMSREAKEVLVRDYYIRFLRRPADPGGLNAFATLLQVGAREEQVIAIFVGSLEYYNRL